MFAVKRGEVRKRFDVRFNSPKEEVELNVGKVLLGSLCSQEPDYGVSGTAIERTDESQPKYIRITDFSDHGIDDNHTFVTVNDYSDKHRLQEGDIIFARSGATVGKTFYYDGTIGDAIFAGYCIRFRIDGRKALPKYIYWYTKCNFYLNWVNSIQRPSGQPNINKEEYKTFEIFLPEIDTQYHFVEFMNAAAQSRREKLREADALLSGISDFVCKTLKINIQTGTPKLGVGVTMRQLKADKAFNVEYYHAERTNTITAIKAVPHKRLGDCVYFIRDIVSANDGQYLGLAGVQSNTGELSGAEDEATGQAFIFCVNDVLYCRLRPYLNKVWKAEYNGVCSTEFHVLRMKNNNILPEYLAAVMRSTLVLNQSRHMMTGNTHPRITNADVANLLIPVPDMPIQQKIAGEMKNRRDTARALRAEAETEWTAAKAQFERELLGGKTRK
jgi:type I restriction enzyme, S subunit